MPKVMMKGNEALGEAAVRAGVRMYCGYPITPQTEIMEYLSWRLPEVGGVFLLVSPLAQREFSFLRFSRPRL